MKYSSLFKQFLLFNTSFGSEEEHSITDCEIQGSNLAKSLLDTTRKCLRKMFLIRIVHIWTVEIGDF